MLFSPGRRCCCICSFRGCIPDTLFVTITQVNDPADVTCECLGGASPVTYQCDYIGLDAFGIPTWEYVDLACEGEGILVQVQCNNSEAGGISALTVVVARPDHSSMRWAGSSPVIFNMPTNLICDPFSASLSTSPLGGPWGSVPTSGFAAWGCTGSSVPAQVIYEIDISV